MRRVNHEEVKRVETHFFSKQPLPGPRRSLPGERIAHLGALQVLRLLRDTSGGLGLGYRVDFVVEETIVVELKTVDRLLPVHDAQVLTYLKILNLRQGFLINFNI